MSDTPPPPGVGVKGKRSVSAPLIAPRNWFLLPSFKANVSPFCLIFTSPYIASAGVKDNRVKPRISIVGIRESKAWSSPTWSRRRISPQALRASSPWVIIRFLAERAESCLGRDCMAQLVRQSPPPGLLLMGPGAVIVGEVIVIVVALDMMIVVIEHKADQL